MKLPEEFLALSARVGADPLLTQGPGGNTSFKSGGTMWVKASGTELADAERQEIFVAVDRERAIREIDGEGDGSCRAAVIDSNARLRPSIETTFHALLPQRIVFHVHSVATICHAISTEGLAALPDKLSGHKWIGVGYRKPGIPLSRAIRSALPDGEAEVVILENHGLIVAGENVASVRSVLDSVEQRLDLAPKTRKVNVAETVRIPEGWERIPRFALLALDPREFARATEGSYYPDHVTFLGPGLPVADAEDWDGAEGIDANLPAVLVPGAGVFMRRNSTRVQRQLLECLWEILRRVPDDWNLRAIGERAEAELLEWDAEKYRIELARNRR